MSFDELRLWKAPLATAAVLVFAGCSHVSQDDLAVELSAVEQAREQMRQELMAEIEAGDQEVTDALSARIAQVEQRLNTLASELTALEQEFEVTVERMGMAIRFHVPVYFGYDEAGVRQQDQEVLDRFADVVQEFYPGVLITAEGFTDPAGDAEYNRQLGLRRAQAVTQYLSEQGFGPNQLRAVSYGEDVNRQVAPGQWGEDGEINRRVILVIEGEAPSATETDTEQTQG